jgi:NAD dependent epimerase/dehydratase family enzyme
MGEFGAVLLSSQRVVPGKLMDSGFEFRYADLEEALQDIVTGDA